MFYWDAAVLENKLQSILQAVTFALQTSTCVNKSELISSPVIHSEAFQRWRGKQMNIRDKILSTQTSFDKPAIVRNAPIDCKRGIDLGSGSNTRGQRRGGRLADALRSCSRERKLWQKQDPGLFSLSCPNPMVCGQQSLFHS